MRTRKGLLVFMRENISQVHLKIWRLLPNNLAHLKSLISCFFHDFIHSAQWCNLVRLCENQNSNYILFKIKQVSLEVTEGLIYAVCNSSTDTTQTVLWQFYKTKEISWKMKKWWIQKNVHLYHHVMIFLFFKHNSEHGLTIHAAIKMISAGAGICLLQRFI